MGWAILGRAKGFFSFPDSSDNLLFKEYQGFFSGRKAAGA
jgi:hypothetical protein